MAQRLELEGGGHLEIREDGPQVHLSVWRGMDGAGLYKAWLRGNGPDFLLGTLMPEGEYLKLQRTLSLDTLKRVGCWPISGGRTAMSFHFTGAEPQHFSARWRWEHRPSARFSDPLLADSAASWGSMLLRETEQGFQLAAPFDPRRPFPITMLFCLARVAQVDGQPHVVFSFQGDGTPRQMGGLNE